MGKINIIRNAEVIFMRLTLAQLRKLAMPYHTSEKLDVSEELNGFEDIKGVSLVDVEYEVRERGLDTYWIRFSFKVDLVMQCAVTLQDVPYTISATAEEIFSTEDVIEDVFPIVNQTLDTKEAVLTNVLIHKPMKVLAEGVEFEEEEETDLEESDGINPAFSGLKDLL